MSYVSLYRKYRSTGFDEIVGQDHITTTLKNAIEKNRIGHAYLFSGTRGTGKTSTARIFAKALNCVEGPTPTPCNKCDICLGINSDTLFDVIEIDAASNRGIDDIRDLREKVRIPPTHANFKVYIIDEVHMLTREAFNALLKTLEEPPSYVKFIMATTEPQKLLSTILSRCQRFDFRRLSESEIAGHLQNIASKENFTIEDEALNTIVKTADGSMRDSISILDQLVSFSGDRITSHDVNQVFGLVERKEIASFMDAVFNGDASRTFEQFNGFFQSGKSFSLFIRYLMEYVRDLYLIKQKIRPSKDLYSDDEIKPLIRQAKSVTGKTLSAILDEMARVEDRIRWETYPRIVLEVFVVRLLDMVSGKMLVKDESEAPELKEIETKEEAPAPKPAPAPAPENIPKPAPRRPEPAQEPVQKKAPPPPAPRKAPPPPPEPEPYDDEPPLDAYEQDVEPRQSASKPAQSNIVDPLPVKYPEVEDVEPDLSGDSGDEELNMVRQNWKKILAEVKEQNLPSYFHIANGIPVALDGGMLLIEFSRDHRFHKDQAEELHNKKILEKAIDTITGKTYSFRCRVASGDVARYDEEKKLEPQPQEKSPEPPRQEPPKPVEQIQKHEPVPEPVKIEPVPEQPAKQQEPAIEENKIQIEDKQSQDNSGEEKEARQAPRELSLFDAFSEEFPDSQEID